MRILLWYFDCKFSRKMRILLLGPLFIAVLFGQPAQQSTGPLTDQRIIELVRAGISADELRRIIATAPSIAFDLSPAATDAMLRAGVTEDTIKMMAAKESPAVPSPAAPSSRTSAGGGPPAQTQSTSDSYQGRGMWDIGLSATAFIPHASPSDAFGLVNAEVGYFVTRGSLLSGAISAFFTGGAQDYFMVGSYRYFFGKGTSRILPYVGGGAGGNVAHAGGLGTAGNFLAQGGGGLRFFLAQHVAIDVGYNLDYIHVSGVGFKDSSYSVVSIGFADVFGRGR